MRNISIYARTYYVRLSVAAFLLELKGEIYPVENLSIFVFEGTWINLKDFLTMTECTSKRILIIAKEETINFLSAILKADKISYACIDTALTHLKQIIKTFIQCPTPPISNQMTPTFFLQAREWCIISLYLQGKSNLYISMAMKKSSKQINNLKRYTMKKTGVFSDAALVNYWRIITHWSHLIVPESEVYRVIKNYTKGLAR